MKKTKQELQLEVEKYIKKCSEHLFVINKDTFYKIHYFEKGSKKYYAIIMLRKDWVNITVRPIEINEGDYYYTMCGNGYPNVIKQTLFSTYNKTKSIPYFKKMKEVVSKIMNAISLESKDNIKLASEYKDELGELFRTT